MTGQMWLASFLCLAMTFSGVLGASYTQTESISGSDFYDAFSFQAISDPTHGRVNYVSASAAKSANLTYASSNHFVLRSDFKKQLSSSGPGRDSVRIQSNNQYTTAVMIFNIRHMPQGCGTWPAVWTVGGNWPNQGEIDILEGVNDQSPNQVTLHTNAGCTMPSSRSQTGNAVLNDCNVATTNNAGCGVKLPSSQSYGPSFNSNGGGWYALERRNSGIKVWFWPRNGGVPSEVSSGAGTINTSNWGTPSAYFPSDNCDIASKFGPHNIIINLTFCGDWAGSVYGSSGCPNYVNNNPGAFTDAYFDFAWLNIYE
ncbi:hypothetical protein D9758_014362 [Tetrapyrgos nigripes]|uniref:GH16 domain-containing protein n=1 Tax=Tetrapyrgos nigripes TaxID=182062 RepID=A0A8H5C6Y3_9AGAR|nr:hypothetical protein D9758_014362 [Tetrapyrgos nigripes]